MRSHQTTAYLSPCHHLINFETQHTKYQNASQSRPAHISLQAVINLILLLAVYHNVIN